MGSRVLIAPGHLVKIAMVLSCVSVTPCDKAVSPYPLDFEKNNKSGYVLYS